MMRLGRAALCSSSGVRREGLWREGRRQWGDGVEGGREQGRADTDTATLCVSACAGWIHAAPHRLAERPPGGGEGADREARRRGGQGEGEQHKRHARRHTHTHTHTHKHLHTHKLTQTHTHGKRVCLCEFPCTGPRGHFAMACSAVRRFVLAALCILCIVITS